MLKYSSRYNKEMIFDDLAHLKLSFVSLEQIKMLKIIMG